MDLVFLHGPAASGKLTLARALEARTGFPDRARRVVDAEGGRAASYGYG